jgi:hypothetical protein
VREWPTPDDMPWWVVARALDKGLARKVVVRSIDISDRVVIRGSAPGTMVTSELYIVVWA